MKRHLIKYLICLGFIVAGMICSDVLFSAEMITVGSPFPSFKISSGANEPLTLEDIKGKVTVLFYEWKSAVEDNRALKTALKEFYANEPESLKKDIMKVAVVNCDGVIFSGIWKSALRSVSIKEGLTIYADWDGKMSDALGVKRATSNVFIIDTNGIVRYVGSGKLDDTAIKAIETLLASFKKPIG